MCYRHPGLFLESILDRHTGSIAAYLLFLIKVKDLLCVADVRESKSVPAASGTQLMLILRICNG